MSKFDQAFDYMIQYEGNKFVDNRDDKGGPTKFGISSKFIAGLKDDDELPSAHVSLLMKNILDEVVKKSSISDLKFYISTMGITQAKWIYQKYFWLPIYEQIENQAIASYVFDMHVQHGAHKAAEIVQRACNAASSPKIKVDGMLGDETLWVVNDLYKQDFGLPLIIALHAVRESLYRCIVVHDPSQKQFLNGWLKRAYGEKL